MLGEFEYLLITVAAGLGENAYGAAIREEIEATTERRCSLGALYTTIERLEKKGMLKTWMGEATPQRGGRAKRMVHVTPKGMRAAKQFYEAMMRASRSVCHETTGRDGDDPFFRRRIGMRCWAIWRRPVPVNGALLSLCSDRW